MTYTPQQWSDMDPTKPASAARFSYMEGGIKDASDRLDLLTPVAAGGQVGQVPVVTQVDGTGKPTAFGLLDRHTLVIDASAPPYNADNTGVTDASPGLTAAIQAARDAGGGRVQLRKGTYRCKTTIPLYSDVVLVGAGRAVTVIKLWDAANTDLIKSDQFDTLVGGNTNGGIQRAGIFDLTLDGNRANQTTGTGACLSHYGSLLVMERVIARYARGDGIYSEWSNNAVIEDGCEGHFKSVVTHDNGGNGISWGGPHDSMWSDCISFQNDAAGYWIRPGAAIHAAQQCHSWGVKQTYAWKLETATFLTGCQGEGASVAQVLVGANDCQIVGGKYFGFGATAKGVLIGDATHLGITGTRLETMIQTCPAGHLDLTNSGGAGFLSVNIYGTGTGVIGSTKTNEVELIAIGGGATGVNGPSFGGNTTFYGGSNSILVVGVNQKFNVNSTGSRVECVNGTDFVVYSDNYSTQKARIFGASGAIKVGSDATASRPSASTLGVGTQFFDTTLNKPIWSDGTNWRDAAGTVV